MSIFKQKLIKRFFFVLKMFHKPKLYEAQN